MHCDRLALYHACRTVEMTLTLLTAPVLIDLLDHDAGWRLGGTEGPAVVQDARSEELAGRSGGERPTEVRAPPPD